jgi:hypothetical protein
MQVAEKASFHSRQVSGHGFIRAVNASKYAGFSP